MWEYHYYYYYYCLDYMSHYFVHGPSDLVTLGKLFCSELVDSSSSLKPVLSHFESTITVYLVIFNTINMNCLEEIDKDRKSIVSGWQTEKPNREIQTWDISC